VLYIFMCPCRESILSVLPVLLYFGWGDGAISLSLRECLLDLFLQFQCFRVNPPVGSGSNLYFGLGDFFTLFVMAYLVSCACRRQMRLFQRSL